MTTPLLFKKYANRRLYSMADSRYVSIADLAELIRKGHDLSVVDAKTNEDVTAFVLTQIILEEARNKNALLPASLLHLIIRYGDNVLVEFFENHLRWIIERYMEFRQVADKQFLTWLDFGKSLSKTAHQGFRSMSSFHDYFSTAAKTGEEPEKET